MFDILFLIIALSNDVSFSCFLIFEQKYSVSFGRKNKFSGLSFLISKSANHYRVVGQKISQSGFILA